MKWEDDMELFKKNIHMECQSCKSMLQLTLDDDFNVPDAKPDIAKIMKEQGNVVIREINPMNGKYMIRGDLCFQLLYISDEEEIPVHNMTGKISFEELVNMEEACGEENMSVQWDIDDMTAMLINSRKVSVKAVISLKCGTETVYDEETAIGIEEREDIQYQNKPIQITGVAMTKKDTYRIKDEITLPMGKANIREILYSDLELRNTDTRVMEDKIAIKGDVLVFVLYMGDTREDILNCYEWEVPFNGFIECAGCNEKMISSIHMSIANKDLQVKPDEDGEERVLDLEAVLELDMKIYEEEELDVLSDVYSTMQELVPVYKEAHYRNLLVKNNSKLRILEQVSLENNQSEILQICSSTGVIKIDEERIVENGIEVEGILEVQILYITQEDRQPVGAWKVAVPFEQMIEVKNIQENSTYEIQAGMEQLNVTMTDSMGIEIKAVIDLDTIVFQDVVETIITDVTEEGSLNEKKAHMPSLVGYVVEEGDTLWSIAKEFYTTPERIREWNDMEDDAIQRGDKLLLMKEMESVL